jgi:Protein of unknown function (DUF3352)
MTRLPEVTLTASVRRRVGRDKAEQAGSTNPARLDFSSMAVARADRVTTTVVRHRGRAQTGGTDMSDDQTRPMGVPDPGAPSGGDVLAGHERERKHTPWLLIGGVAVVVAALVGGVTYGVQMLSGGGSQPEEALPGGAFAFAKVDLDPSAGQKIDAVRFMRKFPALREKVAEDADLRKVLFESVAADAGWDDVDYGSDVEPWLGKRLAVGAYAPEGKPAATGEFPGPRVVVALQVEDADQAEAGLKRLADSAEGGGDPPGFVVEGDYALLAETADAARKAVRDAENGTLAEQDNLSSDLGSMDDGVAAVWVDNQAATKALGGAASMLGGGLGAGPGLGGSGRSTFVLRFDGPDVFEVVGSTTDADVVTKGTGTVKGFAELPDGTVAALGLADGQSLLADAWESFRKSMDAASGASGGPGFDEMVAQAEQELGIDLPDDLAVLLGSNLVAALGGEGLGSGALDLGAKVTTDGEKAMSILDRIEAAATRLGSGSGFDSNMVVRRTTDDGYVIGSSKATLDKLEQPGKLGEDEAFGNALPDLDGAGFALWVDLAALFDGFMGSDGVNENLEPIDGLGVTTDIEGDGSATFRMRLVAH